MNEREFLAALRKTRGEWKIDNAYGRLTIRTKKSPHACPLTRLDPLGASMPINFPNASSSLKLREQLARHIVNAADDNLFNAKTRDLRRKLLAATGLVAEERRLKREFARRTS